MNNNVIKMSKEQLEAINCELRVVSIQAPAGSGKTTLLENYVKKRENSKFLYCSFGRDIVRATNISKFKNVECKTIHSIAYNQIGFKYKNKIKPKLEIKDILSYARLPINKKTLYVARAVLETLSEFNFSSDLDSEIFFEGYVNETFDSFRNEIIEYSNVFWNSSINVKTKTPITHDTYLKLFQMNPVILNYDYFLFDEAQDGNQAMLSLLMYQIKKTNDKKIVLVGDKYQSIHAFRGSVNVFENITPSKSFYLKKSYRFGENIASVINDILVFLDSEVLVEGVSDNKGLLEAKTDRKTIISRSNATLFNRAIKLSEKNISFSFLGGIEKYNFEIIRDIYYLKRKMKKKIINPFILNFDSFNDLENFAIKFKEREIIYFCNLVKQRENIPNLLNKILSVSKNVNNNSIVLTNVHKAKGLEFDNVELTNDFYSPFNSHGELKRKINFEEIRVLYVAASRAKNNLIRNKVLLDLHDYNKNIKITKKSDKKENNDIVFIDNISKR